MKAHRIFQTIKKIFLSILLFSLAGFCIIGIYFLAIRMNEKDAETARLARIARESISENQEASLPEEELSVETPSEETSQKKTATPDPAQLPLYAGDVELAPGYKFFQERKSPDLPAQQVDSKYAFLVNLATNEILVNKEGDKKIYPASMTKILTCLVAAERIQDLDAPFTLTQEMEEYCLLNECSAAGFRSGETVPIRDLFYGTILPSGGEAAVALATAAAGSQKAFVKLMNKKLEELGIADTAHFTNCVGIHNEKHYCTLSDMAVILKAAIQNDWAREVLSTHVYETTHTEENPEGLILNNWFLRRIEDYDTRGPVLCAKTGFVDQSGFCAASYMVTNDGVPYICVTGNTYNEWRSVYDHIYIYATHATK